MALRARAPSSAKSKQAAMPRSAPRRRRSLAHFMAVEAAEVEWQVRTLAARTVTILTADL